MLERRLQQASKSIIQFEKIDKKLINIFYTLLVRKKLYFYLIRGIFILRGDLIEKN